jgi:internalin A
VGLWYNPSLSSIPREIGLLHKLKVLYLGPCELSELPAEFGQLRALEFLYLSADKLASLTPEFCRLTRLYHLALNSPLLHELPACMRALKALTFLSLDCPLGIPAEIANKTRRPKEILNYYFRSRRGSRPLNEAKLIITGRGGVGKTCLLKRLIKGTFNEREAETAGIEIQPWEVSLDTGDHVRLHVWDFGGQEILHATHQFFLTERTIYLVVLTGREGLPTQDAEYWLQLIRSFGADSSVIVVLNKSQAHPFDVNRGLLLEKYPQIAGFVHTDCRQMANGAIACAGDHAMGIEQLRQLILTQTEVLEHRKADFPADWFAVKERLAGMKENFVTWDQYQNICNDLGERDAKAQRDLAGFLHVLGIALNYRDDPRLRDTHVLNPRWVTEGIYTLLRAGQKMSAARGVLRATDLRAVLSANDYPDSSHRFLLTLMEKFQLCFPLPGETDSYLVPELLSENQPEDIATLLAEPGLRFRYQYEVLPEGLLPRFIVQTHTYSEPNPQWRWRTGVVLSRESCRAVVRADARDRRVDIHVTGPKRKRSELLTVIRERFDEQHRDLKGLTVDQRVPHQAHPNLTISYEFLLQLEAEGEPWCRPEGSPQKVRVTDLLDGIESPQLRAQRRNQSDSDPATQTAAKEHVFLSYCHDNASEASQLRDELIDAGESIWWDGDILGGQDWQHAIRRAMKSSYAVVLCLSKELERRVQSGVYPELLDAIREYRLQAPGHVFLIPVKLNACEIPDVEVDNARTLDRLQAIDLFPPDRRGEGLQRLLQSLKAAPYHP